MADQKNTNYMIFNKKITIMAWIGRYFGRL